MMGVMVGFHDKVERFKQGLLESAYVIIQNKLK
jgi:hypothetical protein